ncbi:methyltransferase domain-containing protein, partial [Candidatus Bathyarchaeota archaeon]|nr:methyltransferase domain-containing protein [Candidatus Bathyarchaeota archaeon]
IGRSVGFAVGVDLSQALLSWARSKLREVQNLDLLLSDADYLPFKEEVFDAVFAITLLQNLPEPRKTLSEAMRVAKPEAPIVVSGLKKKYNREEFEDLLSSTGLRVREIMDGELKDFVAICGKKVS